MKNEIIRSVIYNASKMLLQILLIISSFISCLNADEPLEYGSGIIYGDKHAFMLTAPEGWVIDSKSGVSQGFHAVFYPEGQTWQDSPVIAYAMARVKNDIVSAIEGQVDATINDFKANGSPNFQAKYLKTIDIPNDKKAVIYAYQGDQWGNYEAAAYIDEEKTLVYIILSSRTEQFYNQSLEVYYKLVASYCFLGEDVNLLNLKEKP